MKQGDITLSTIGKLVLVLIVVVVLAFIFSENVRRLGSQVLDIGESQGNKSQTCLENPDAPECDVFGEQETSAPTIDQPLRVGSPGA